MDFVIIINLLCYASMNSSQRALHTYEKIFANFELVFDFLAVNRIFSKRIARREYWSNCNVLQINGFVSTSSTNWWKAFFKFWIFGQKQKIFKRIERREYWLKCNVLYINEFDSTSSTNELKLFQNFGIIFRISYIFLNNSCVVFMQARWGRHLCWTAHVLVWHFFLDVDTKR